MTHNHNPLPEHELLTHKSFLKSLNTVDCLFALLTAAGAFFAQTRIQHAMDIYEMVILWASAGITVFLGWFFKPMRWFAPLCAVLAYGAVMLYDAKLSQVYAARLLDEGIYVTGFYYPVVPKGEARIRVQLSAGHTREQLDKCIAAFIKVGKELGVLK